MNIDLESLGITKEELASRVVEGCVRDILESVHSDENGRESRLQSHFEKEVKKAVMDSAAKAVDAMCEKVLTAGIGQLIAEFAITPTNTYGEKKGEPITFAEFILKRAGDYLQHKVDPRTGATYTDSYSRDSYPTRASWLINSALHEHLKATAQNAIAGTNKTIADAMNAAILEAVNNVKTQISVVTTKD